MTLIYKWNTLNIMNLSKILRSLFSDSGFLVGIPSIIVIILGAGIYLGKNDRHLEHLNQGNNIIKNDISEIKKSIEKITKLQNSVDVNIALVNRDLAETKEALNSIDDKLFDISEDIGLLKGKVLKK